MKIKPTRPEKNMDQEVNEERPHEANGKYSENAANKYNEILIK